MRVLRLHARRIALVLIFALLNQTFFPAMALALTSGPTQPEASAFTPAGTSDMVDLFSGDFHYNIPLLDVGGYPINIAYNAGTSMDEEASWVGLGWSLNPGAINRQMRGLPDDFRGDSILKVFKIKPDVTTGINVGGALELTGIPLKWAASMGIFHNNYRGYGLTGSISPTLTIPLFNKTGLTSGLGLRYDSQNGFDLTPSFGLYQMVGKTRSSINSSLAINSQKGLKDLSISYNFNYDNRKTGNKNKRYNDGLEGSTISFNGFTYTPTSELPLKNNSFIFHGTVGFEYMGGNPSVQVDGYRSEQSLTRNQQNFAAFGYLNSQLAKSSDVMDFNRERNGLPWREHMPVLPPAFGTNDLFAASGQGASGQYRAIRSDIGYYRDVQRTNESDSKSLGVELGGLPNLVKVGIDVTSTEINASTQGWTENNPMSKTSGYTNWNDTTIYEPVFFKNSGEMTMTDPLFFDKVGKTSPAQPVLESTTGAVRTAFQFSSNQQPSVIKTFSAHQDSTIRKSGRERRTDVWQYLNARETIRHGLDKTIYSYKKGQIRLSKDLEGCGIDTTLNRYRFKHYHISEVTILKSDGARYVYGLPTYNTYQKEVSFSINEDTVDNGRGLIQYGVNDNSLQNNQGRDNYFSADVLPPYTYAFMLTGVLSPDYIDRKGDGITSDDYGTAVRINYTKNKALYKWRTPYGMKKSTIYTERIARYQPGRKSDKKGKKASYIYGTKEVWYVHSIESATMTAQFYTSSRLDGLGVLNENGGVNTDSLAGLQKLDKIELYSKADLQKYGDDATPIKTVHFKYDYELCPDTYNSNGTTYQGKLTLKQIWFTYGKSGRGKLNAYSFHYKNGPDADPDNRFFYNMTNVDRWGNYKIHPFGYPNTTDFPYALQDSTRNSTSGVEASLHDFAGAWCMDSITLPSGGIISIDYESDDYAYIQNKRAGQMYFVKGFSRASSPTTIDSLLYTGTSEANMSRYVWVDLDALNLPHHIFPDTNAFKARCLEKISNIWFHMDVRMADKSVPIGPTDMPREDITGYMEYDKRFPLQMLSDTSAFGIPIKIVQTDQNKPIHPVTQAALQTMRLELPDLAYPGTEASTTFEAVIKGLVGLIQTIKTHFKGFEVNKMNQGNAKYVGVTGMDGSGPKTSWIRLCNAHFKKFGGGHRVKKISLNDVWDTMASGHANASYGQEYTYSTLQKVIVGNSEQTFTISSGVACWEPSIGGEENLWKEPVTLNDRIKLAPDNSYYVEKPFGESLFPAAMVGYSEVKVQNIGYAVNKRTGSGWTVNRYYTAREFPTISDYTAPMRHKDSNKKLFKFFKLQVKDFLSMTQGFVIEVNDMHGKIKEEAVYAQNGSLVSSTRYDYKVDNINANPMHLNNKVRVATSDGDITQEKLLGVDIEVWQDFREETTFTQGNGFGANSDGFIAFIPILLLAFKGLNRKEELRFRSAVTTKFIKRTGILNKITKIQDGSTITTENLLWDRETGAVLATKTQNEFEDPIYQFSYPAHWISAFEGMGMAYKNAGAHLTGIYFHNGVPYLQSGGVHVLPNYAQMFVDGDEFGALRYPSRWLFTDDTLKLTSYKVGSTLKFYTDDGLEFSSGTKKYAMYMVRPGRRNMAGAPVGTLVSKTNPLNFSTIQDFATNAGSQMVNASANLFWDEWQRNCNCDSVSTGDTINPYRHGMKGNWRLRETYVNHQQRSASKLLTSVGSTNIRKDGTIPSFVPFWEYVSDEWQPGSDPEWVKQSKTNVYDGKGNPSEEIDALGIYSSAYYGYNGNLNTAVAHNTRFRQGMFDGFEDYQFDLIANCDSSNCSPKKFDTVLYGGSTETPTDVSDSIAHTGKYSLKIPDQAVQALRLTFDSNTNTTILQKLNENRHYGLGPNACIPAFNPTPGSYVVSGWVYTGGPCNTIEMNGSTPPSIAVYQQHEGLVQNIAPSGPIIEGWQRMYKRIEVTADTGSLEIRLINTLDKPVYFDDVRMHPWQGNMKSFAYDPVSLRLMATLDENNYATFYEYDDEGMLIRVKRETEQGIMTVEEHRSYLKY